MEWCWKVIFFLRNEKEIWGCLHQWYSLAQGSTFIANLLIGSTLHALGPIAELPRSKKTRHLSPEEPTQSRNNFPQMCQWVLTTVCFTLQTLSCCTAALANVIGACLVVNWAQNPADLSPVPFTFAVRDGTEGAKGGRGKITGRFRCPLVCRYWSGFYNTQSGTLNRTA